MHEREPVEEKYAHHLADVHFVNANLRPDGSCPEWVLQELYKQRATDMVEGGVPHAVIPIDQPWDPYTESYVGYGDSTIRHSLRGINDLDLTDPRNEEELTRRGAELKEEIRLTRDEPLRERLASEGLYKIALSCPSYDRYARRAFNYDSRTMVRAQTISPDKQTKRSLSIAIFDIPNEYYAKFAKRQWGAVLSEDSAAMLEQSVAQDLLVQAENPFDLIDWLYVGLREVIDDPQILEILEAQYAETVANQREYQRIVAEKADESVQWVLDVARSMREGYATPEVLKYLQSIYANIADDATKQLINESWRDEGLLFFGEDLAKFVMKAKKNTLEVRAGVLSGNERIIMQVVAQGGSVAVMEIRQAEHAALQAGNFTRVDGLVSTMNIRSGGGCSVTVADLFGANQKSGNTAEERPSDAASANTWDGGKKHFDTHCACCKLRKFEVGACYICQDCMGKPAKRDAAYNAYLAENGSARTVAQAVGELFKRSNLFAPPAPLWATPKNGAPSLFGF